MGKQWWQRSHYLVLVACRDLPNAVVGQALGVTEGAVTAQEKDLCAWGHGQKGVGSACQRQFVVDHPKCICPWCRIPFGAQRTGPVHWKEAR